MRYQDREAMPISQAIKRGLVSHPETQSKAWIVWDNTYKRVVVVGSKFAALEHVRSRKDEEYQKYIAAKADRFMEIHNKK